MSKDPRILDKDELEKIVRHLSAGWNPATPALVQMLSDHIDALTEVLWWYGDPDIYEITWRNPERGVGTQQEAYEDSGRRARDVTLHERPVPQTTEGASK